MDDFQIALHPPNNQVVEWRQPNAMQRQFELNCGDTLLATIEFASAFGSLALAVCSQGRWTFKRMGFFNTRVVVRREGEELDLGVYRPRWTNAEGAFEMNRGASYTWKTANFWATRYLWLAPSGMELVTYRSGVLKSKLSDTFKNQARMEVAPGGSLVSELPLLALLGFYLIELQREDSAAAAV